MFFLFVCDVSYPSLFVVGWHEARVPTIATSVPRATFGFCTKALKESNVVSIPLVSTNRINDPSTAEALLQEDTSDMVSMARPFLADPDFMLRAWNQESDFINTCIACNQACLDHAFVGKTASCLVNPFACHETELIVDPLPEAQRLNLGVVGAGPAGCAFALTAAGMGHSVTLYDQAKDIGGQFHMAKRIPGKEEFHETLRYFRNSIQQNRNIDLKLDTCVDYEGMLAANKDKWVIATGVTPRDPQIPGQEHPNVLSYIDVLKRNKEVGSKVAIIGAGGIGFDVSEFLLYHEADKTHKEVSIADFWREWGIDSKQSARGGLLPQEVQHHKKPKRQVHLLQRKQGKLGANLGRTTGWIHRATLKAGNVNMINGVSYDKVDIDGNLHYTKNNTKHVLDVDTIVLCAGQVEERTLQELVAVKNNARLDSRNVYTIGGAEEAGELDAKQAIDMGTRLALKIHQPNVIQGNHVFQAAPTTEEQLFKLLQKFTK